MVGTSGRAQAHGDCFEDAFTVHSAPDRGGIGSITADPNAPYCPEAGYVAEEENFFQGGGSVCGSTGQQPDILYQDGIPD